ncbi:hypothetical protein PINS_up009282 [Pythium insidiosum]|nr:hypothetical protein PINS_up009282 [Pythium insidiosum]
MLVVSVSSRIVADAFVEGRATGFASLRNARKVYALTVGRLAWNVTDLAQTYNATCEEGVGLCYGLLFVLPSSDAGVDAGFSARPDASSMTDGQRHLLVGDDFLPVETLGAFNYNDTERRSPVDSDDIVQWTPLLSISATQSETPSQTSSSNKRKARARVASLGSDVLLPHNVGDAATNSTSTTRDGKACSAAVEARVRHLLGNHLYMERGLQTAYTAGMFFLFQNAVVKECVSLADGRMTLKFDRNIEWIDFLVSAPGTNVILTLTGCLLLVVMAAWVSLSLLRQRRQAAVAGAAYVTPQVLAKVLLDEDTFPPALLQRRLLAPSSQPGSAPRANAASAELLEEFAIEGLRLQREADGMAVELPMGSTKQSNNSSV